MSAFTALPLGQPVPPRLHAVSCSIPTIEDLRGYEEKRPETLRHMSSGYPRFVVHPLVRRLGELLSARNSLSHRRLWLTGSERIARDLLAWLAVEDAQLFTADGLWGIHHVDTPELFSRSKSFLQHTGGFLSSRRAEEELVRLGHLPALAPETVYPGNNDSVRAAAWSHLAPLFRGASDSDAFFCSTGMNAVHAAFRAVDTLQASRGRRIWVQLGWLYLDTIAIMKKFSRGPHSYAQVRRVNDRAALERLFAEQGNLIAGIIAEVPSNPLIQTPDVAWLAGLARSHGARLILDPSVASAYSADLFLYSDILVTSLTKYSAHEGDVIAGLAVVNPNVPDAAALREGLVAQHEPLWPRDLARLTVQLPTAPEATARMESNLRAVVAFLETRPEVGRVYWSRGYDCAANFAAVARNASACGGMLSFELKVPLQPFYDTIHFPKGPSFGMSTTLISAFIWIAHYDLVTTETGRAELAANGIDPDLVRLAVGTENIEDILAELSRSLDAARQA